jgi:hypothetical protein
MNKSHLFIVGSILIPAAIAFGAGRYSGQQAGYRSGMIEGLDAVAIVAAENPSMTSRQISNLAIEEADRWRSGAVTE